MDALELFLRERPQLLVVDYFMPGMTGEELVREIRRKDQFVQILLQTGYSGEKPPQEMLEALDIQGYHDKTDGAHRFLVWVRVCLKAHRQLQQAREAERLKGELLANMSHEFRTPITISMGCLEMVKDGAQDTLTSEARGMLDRVEDNMKALLGFITDLLDLAKLETQAAEARIEPVALPTLRANAASSVDRIAGEKAVKLCWDVPDDSPAVRADRSKLSLALSQILLAAVGNISEGEVWVRTSEPAPGMLALVVGNGQRPSENGNECATGESAAAVELETVGLNLSRRIMRSIGGDLTVERKPGSGTTFMITLPTASATVPERSSPPDVTP
jgi:signal transduction histidine kinase